jgi:hypothetical protein
VGSDDVRQVRRDVVLAQIDLDSPPTDAIDAYCACTCSRTVWPSPTRSTSMDSSVC